MLFVRACPTVGKAITGSDSLPWNLVIIMLGTVTDTIFGGVPALAKSTSWNKLHQRNSIVVGIAIGFAVIPTIFL